MAALLAWLGRSREQPLPQARFAVALARLAEQGPAGCSRLALPGFALAWLRAGTPGEAQTGPPCTQSGPPGLTGALCGYLYDVADVARELGLPGPPADHTALLLEAFARRAQSGLLALRGAFAGLVYDPRAHELWLRVDVAGQRALYLREDSDGCWIASDESALVPVLDDAALDPLQRARMLCALAPTADSGWFRGVRNVGAGGLWRVDARGAARVLRSPLPTVDVARNRAGVVDQFRALKAQAVARCAAGVSPDALGISLSSGLDSLSVAAHARRLGLQPKAYSWTLARTPASDEGPQVAAAAQALALPLHPYAADHLLPLAGAPRRLRRGELTANIYREIKQRLLQDAAGNGTRVLLTGSGGDQLYGRNRWWLVESLRRGHWFATGAELLWRWTHGVMPWRDAQVRQVWRSLVGRRLLPPLLGNLLPAARSAVLASLEPSDPLEAHLRGPLAARSAAAEHWHAEALGLELRLPLRDPDLLAFAMRVPPHWQARRGVRKWLGRAALTDLLPDPQRLAVKIGDLGQFLVQALAGESGHQWRALLSAPGAQWSAFVDPESVVRAMSDPGVATDLELLQVWQCVALELWRKTCTSTPHA